MIVLGYWSLIPLNSTAIGMITRYIFPGVFQFGHMYTIAGWDVYLGEVLLSSAFIIVLGYMNVKASSPPAGSRPPWPCCWWAPCSSA